MLMGVVRSRWASWSSKPVAGRVAGRGGFDSHPLSPIITKVTLKGFAIDWKVLLQNAIVGSATISRSKTFRV